MIFTDRFGQELHAGDQCVYAAGNGVMIDVTLVELIPLIPHRSPNSWNPKPDNIFMREDQARRSQHPTEFYVKPETPEEKRFVAKYRYNSYTDYQGKDHMTTKSTPAVSALVKVPA